MLLMDSWMVSFLANFEAQCCAQVISLHKLQIADDECLTIQRHLSTGTTMSISARDNLLPFRDSCPRASTSRIGNDPAAFQRQGHVVKELCTKITMPGAKFYVLYISV